MTTHDIPREKTLDPRHGSPRTFIYPIEIAGIMELVKIGNQNTLPAEPEQVGVEIAALCGAWAQNIDLKLYSNDQALQADSRATQWILCAQNAALGSFTFHSTRTTHG
jgi:hypothetical protein